MKNRFHILWFYSAFFAIIETPQSYAAECPIPPTSVMPNLSVKVNYDQKTKIYTYDYTLGNQSGAKLDISSLLLEMNTKPLDSLAPTRKWIRLYDEAAAGMPANFTWSSLSDRIRPGSKSSGFVLKSYLAPAPIRYYVLGNSGVRVGTPTAEDDEPIPDCQGFYDGAPGLEGNVSGIVDGPAPDNQVSVDLKLMDSRGERECDPISPYEDKGLLNVLLKVNKNVKISDIDLTSLRLGVGHAPLSSSKRMGNSEEVILLKFDIQKIAIECDRDRVLFLTGKTTDGKEIFGAAPVKTKSCDKRPKRAIPEHRKNPHHSH